MCTCCDYFGTVVDAGGERPGGPDDRSIPTGSDYPDGPV